MRASVCASANFPCAQMCNPEPLLMPISAEAHAEPAGALTVSVYCCMVMYYVWLYCCTDWCIHTVYETTCVVTLTDVLLMYFDVF